MLRVRFQNRRQIHHKLSKFWRIKTKQVMCRERTAVLLLNSKSINIFSINLHLTEKQLLNIFYCHSFCWRKISMVILEKSSTWTHRQGMPDTGRVAVLEIGYTELKICTTTPAPFSSKQPVLQFSTFPFYSVLITFSVHLPSSRRRMKTPTKKIIVDGQIAIWLITTVKNQFFKMKIAVMKVRFGGYLSVFAFNSTLRSFLEILNMNYWIKDEFFCATSRNFWA